MWLVFRSYGHLACLWMEQKYDLSSKNTSVSVVGTRSNACHLAGARPRTCEALRQAKGDGSRGDLRFPISVIGACPPEITPCVSAPVWF